MSAAIHAPMQTNEFMTALISDRALTKVQESAHPLIGAKADYDPLIKLIGSARYVLLGEASHGTHEFYKARVEITKRLVAEKNFTVIGWEADWPDALRVNRYIHQNGHDADAEESLRGFQRLPTWMWRNADILDLVGWLRNYNSKLAAVTPKIGVYGLDLYSLHNFDELGRQLSR